MTRYLRQISATLALVMLFTSAISAVLVACASGSDHYAIELVGHHAEVADHAAEPSVVTTPASEHEAHPDTCADTPLLGDMLIQRDNLSAGSEDNSPQVWLELPVDGAVLNRVAVDRRSWPVWLDVPPARPATEDLSTIRLLI